MPSVISGDANVSATEFGFLDGVTSSLQSQIDAKLPLAGGKILQIVRATDATRRTTTSTTFIDANLSVTITPEKSDSAIIILGSPAVNVSSDTGSFAYAEVRITDSSDNLISGSGDCFVGLTRYTRSANGSGFNGNPFMIGYSTPATTSAVTYKMRYRSNEATATTSLLNDLKTNQLFAIEVSA